MEAVLLMLGILSALSRKVLADNSMETLEKFYTADMNYTPTPGGKHQHGAMGISTVAKFSMLSNTPTLFKVKRPGLQNEDNTVSFESMQKPGYYLRYKNYKFHMEKKDNTKLFAKDATFRERQGPRGRAYELLGRDNWFICHSDETPFTLNAKPEKIGTREFVQDCVYVPVRQTAVVKKNIVKTVPSGGAVVINSVPPTQITDKCISLRFVNKLGGPVRVVSSMKPEGYLVTANAFKLKTIFKHANHKQRHVIFYAENVQDRDDDVLLNEKHVFTIKPDECIQNFQDVVLSSQTDEPKKEMSDSATNKTNTESGTDTSFKTASSNTPQPPAIQVATPRPPALNLEPTKSSATGVYTPAMPTENDATPKPPTTDDDTTKPPAYTTEKAASESGILSPSSGSVTPKPLTTPGAVAYEVGVPGNSVNTASTPQPVTASTASSLNPPLLQSTNAAYTGPLKHKMENLDNVLEKRIQGNRAYSGVGITPSSNAGGMAVGYDAWSSYGPCTVTCGVGYRRRTRVCRPGAYCIGPTAETRACIKEQCASDCIHTTGGSVRPGSCCHFPFTFNGGQYYHCILSPQNNERMWCSTTPYFDQDKQWGYCPRSAKAPVRSLTRSATPIPVPQAQQPSAFADEMTSQYTSYYNNAGYNNAYRAYKDNYIPCSPLCRRVCASLCPRHCCVATTTGVPIAAYLGNNYGPTDKRSYINPYQARYRRNLSKQHKKIRYPPI